jgi:predicted dehydrogenase
MGMSDRDPICVGVIGLGAMGRVHLDAYTASPYAAVRHLCDVDTAAASAHAPDEHTTVSASVDAVAADPDVALVSVCLPHRLHAPTTITLLEAGKAVVLEKPVAVDLDEADKLLAVAHRHPGRLVVKSYLRHSGPFRVLHDAMRRGAVGVPRLATATFASQRRDESVPAWRLDATESGGGVLLDTGIHLIDVLHWCFGQEHSVMAADRTDERGLDLDAALLMAFENGPFATLALTQASAGNGLVYRLEVVGSSGRVTVEPTAPGTLTCSITVDGTTTVLLDEPDWWGRANTAAVASYVENLAAGRPLGEPPEDAVANLATVLTAYACRRAS